MEVVQKVNNFVTGLLNNNQFTVVASLILAMYAGLAAPSLPNSVISFFDTLVGKLLFLFLIGYVASRNIQVALMVAVAYLVTLHVLNQRTSEQYANYVEHFIAQDASLQTDDDTSGALQATREAFGDDDDENLPGVPGGDEGFENGSGNPILGDDPFEGGDIPEHEHPDDDDEEDANDHHHAEGEENDHTHDDDGNVVANTDDGDTGTDDPAEFFTSNNRYSVRPANNLSGNSNIMYAPVKF